MAKRSVVIVSQLPATQPSQRDLEETLVTELMMSAGVDVNLIPHLEDLQPGETGLLCLEGVAGDMVVISWLPAAEAHQTLAEKGVRGRWGRTRWFAPEEQPAGDGSPRSQRTIRCLSFHDADSPQMLLQEIQRIHDDAQVQTFSIGSLAPPAASQSAAIAPPPSAVVPVAAAPVASAPVAPAPVADLSLDEEERVDAEMEDLAAELDEMDL